MSKIYNNKHFKMVSVLCCVIALTLFTTSVFANFKDMNGHWAKQYVDDLAKNNVTQGYEDGTFRPDNTITVAEFAALLDRYFYKGFDRTGTGASTWANEHVSFLEKEGILFNYGSKNSNLTRIVALRTIVSCIENHKTYLKEYEGKKATMFVDGSTIRDSDASYVLLGIANKVIDGYRDGTFRPNQAVTRAEAAKMLFTMKHHEKFEIKKPGSSGGNEKPKGDYIKADGLFTDPVGLDKPIYVTKEQYEKNEVMEIKTPFTADGSEWQGIRMGGFLMAANFTEEEAEDFVKKVLDGKDDDFEFIKQGNNTTIKLKDNPKNYYWATIEWESDKPIIIDINVGREKVGELALIPSELKKNGYKYEKIGGYYRVSIAQIERDFKNELSKK